MEKIDSLKKRAMILLKNLEKEEEIQLKKCNNYIDDLEDIKKELYDFGYEWTEDLDELENLEDGFFNSVEDEEMDEALDEVEAQLKRILTKLGVDFHEKSSNSQNPQINFSPTIIQSQSQYQYQSQSINFEELVEEFKQEAKKPLPNKSKLRKIGEEILKYGKEYSPQLLKVILDYIIK